ncbi:hypothetical protein BRADI_1g61740v3 [Brachypodium distachyon]|uniref:Pentacotripeptide-repeat region of PRORP domain-containing protein n=1 Tax=Brachypodium distachyon TaxID=15368 RepID=A0A0Q3S9C8_BRADI|nr:hypothetical protein BRADI_1g61740v3 [Brachypodium distachyon]
MSLHPRRFIRHICSSSASELASVPTAVSTAASLAADTVLRGPRFESNLLKLIPRALLFDPSCVRLTLSHLLPSPEPSLHFLLFLSSLVPAPEAAPAPSPQLPGVDAFLLRLPPHLAADAAALLASHLGLHPSIPALNAASRAALRAARPDLVFNLFSTFSSSPDFPGDADTVSCLARACAADRRPLDGLRLLRDAARRGSPPSSAAAADLVKAFAASGNFPKVSDTLHLMISAGYPPDTVVYQCIIHGLFAHKMGGEALRVFNEIKLRGYDIDAVTYTTVIDGLCKVGNIVDARKMWDEMVHKGMEPNEYAYCSFLGYYCKAGDFDMAYKVYGEMLGKGFKESTVSCNIILAGFCVHMRVDEAISVFEGMVTEGIEHDVFTYNTLIQGLCKVGRLAEAIRMYQRLLSSGLEPTVSTFTPLIDTMCEEGQVDHAVELFRLMQAKGFEPLVRSNDSVINGFCKARRADDAMAWLAGMLKSNLKPQKQTFNSLLELLSTSERVDDALLILNTMLKSGFGLDSLPCTILVDKLCTGNVPYSHKLEDILYCLSTRRTCVESNRAPRNDDSLLVCASAVIASLTNISVSSSMTLAA